MELDEAGVHPWENELLSPHVHPLLTHRRGEKAPHCSEKRWYPPFYFVGRAEQDEEQQKELLTSDIYAFRMTRYNACNTFGSLEFMAHLGVLAAIGELLVLLMGISGGDLLAFPYEWYEGVMLVAAALGSIYEAISFGRTLQLEFSPGTETDDGSAVRCLHCGKAEEDHHDPLRVVPDGGEPRGDLVRTLAYYKQGTACYAANTRIGSAQPGASRVFWVLPLFCKFIFEVGKMFPPDICDTQCSITIWSAGMGLFITGCNMGMLGRKVQLTVDEHNRSKQNLRFYLSFFYPLANVTWAVYLNVTLPPASEGWLRAAAAFLLLLDLMTLFSVDTDLKFLHCRPAKRTLFGWYTFDNLAGEKFPFYEYQVRIGQGAAGMMLVWVFSLVFSLIGLAIFLALMSPAIAIVGPILAILLLLMFIVWVVNLVQMVLWPCSSLESKATRCAIFCCTCWSWGKGKEGCYGRLSAISAMAGEDVAALVQRNLDAPRFVSRMVHPA